MPRLSLWFVRASLIYLLLGLLFGALMLAEKGISYYPPVWTLFPVHIEFLLVGWLVQLAMGVGFWIFPRFSSGQARGNEQWIWLAFGFVNLGIGITALQVWNPGVLFWGRLFEAIGTICYVMGLWLRVKPHGA